jgi:hypothetical protein
MGSIRQIPLPASCGGSIVGEEGPRAYGAMDLGCLVRRMIALSLPRGGGCCTQSGAVGDHPAEVPSELNVRYFTVKE